MNQDHLVVRQIVGSAEPAARSPRHQVSLVVDGLREFRGSIDLVRLLAVRQFKLQYTQSVLGYGWAVFNPLFQMVIMSFVFSTILRVSIPGIEFPLFLFVGLIGWNFFSNGVASGVDSVAGSMGLITKVYFPREALLVASVIVKLVDLLLASVVLALVMVYYQRGVGPVIAWIPLILLIQLVFTVGVSLPLAALNVYFRDMRYLVQVGLLAWMYLTPVFYPVDIVPPRYGFIFDLNPMSVFINAYRQVLFVGQSPDVGHMGIAIAVSVVVFFAGYWVFRSLGRGFADSV